MIPTTVPTQRSEPGLDLFRGLVVVMMFVVHTRRLQPAAEATALEQALRFFMWTEPYVAASFLFIAGVSLALAHERGGSEFLRKALARSLGLYALAVVLFVPQYGVELPDLVVSPGILSAIALSLAVTALALASASPDRVLALAALVVLGATAWLDLRGASVPGLTAGPGGAFPLVAVSALGAWAWRARWRGLATITLVGALCSLAALAMSARWITEHASLYRVHSGQLALLELAKDARRAPTFFWNHSALGALGLLLPIGATLALLRAAAKRLTLTPLALLGRHALAAYVVHLGLLGVADLTGLAPRSPAQTWLMVAVLTLACLGGAWLLELRTSGRRRDTPPAGRAAGDTDAARSLRRRT